MAKTVDPTKDQSAPPPPVGEDEPGGEAVISQWEFVGKVPTREDVLDLLKTLPPVWGVKTVDYADYVQALPQKKKVKKQHPDNPRLMIDESIECFTLYMSVAGRQKMMEAAAEINRWAVDFEPEPFTPTQIPGYLSVEPRIVYREYVTVNALPDEKQWHGDKALVTPLGRKPGTAWVPATGGSNAAGSNPYEKVETSARGRALAAWGFGVLPGSGVASVEEIQGSRENRVAMEREQVMRGERPGSWGPPTQQGGPRLSRDEMLQQCFAISEELRQARGVEEAEHHARLAQYIGQTLGVRGAINENGEIDWSKVKDGQIMLLTNSLRTSLQTFRDEGSQV